MTRNDSRNRGRLEFVAAFRLNGGFKDGQALVDKDVESNGSGIFPINVSFISCARHGVFYSGYKVRPVRLVRVSASVCYHVDSSFCSRISHISPDFHPHFLTNTPTNQLDIMSPSAAFNDFKAFAMNSPLLLSAVSFLLVAQFIRYLLNRPKRLDLPIVGSPDTKEEDWQEVLIKGSLKVRRDLYTP